MKTVFVLVALGLLLLYFQGDAKRFILEEVTKGKSEEVDSSPTDVKPITGLAPTAIANDERATLPTKIKTAKMIQMRVMEALVILLDHQLRINMRTFIQLIAHLEKHVLKLSMKKMARISM
ncbi:hypothetical protein SLA2020_366310 [Shorea laevis]